MKMDNKKQAAQVAPQVAAPNPQVMPAKKPTWMPWGKKPQIPPQPTGAPAQKPILEQIQSQPAELPGAEKFDENLWNKLEKTPTMPNKGTAMGPMDFDERILEKPKMNHHLLGSVSDSLLKLADAADAAGMQAEADAIAAVLPSIKIFKAAQYEGFQNYWIANGRAFEKAYREKIKSNPSPHKVWWEVLDEFQKGLLGNQHDFISKYAKRSKKEVETAGEGGGEGATMSENMTNFSKNIEEDAKKQGKTVGEMYSKWLDSHNAASKMLMGKISSKVEAGASPGVAFYESMEDFLNGREATKIATEIANAIASVKTAADAVGNAELSAQASEAMTKVAGIWDTVKDIGKGVGGWLKGKMGVGDSTVALAKRIKDEYTNAAAKLGQLVRHPQNMPIYPHHLHDAIAPIYHNLVEYFNRMKTVGMAAPEVPNPAALGPANQPIPDDKLQEFYAGFHAITPYVNDQVAKIIDSKLASMPPAGAAGAVPPAAVGTAPASGTGVENGIGGIGDWGGSSAGPSAAATEISPAVHAAIAKHFDAQFADEFRAFVGGKKAASKKSWLPTKTSALGTEMGFEPSSPQGGPDIRGLLEQFIAQKHPQWANMPFVKKAIEAVAAEAGATGAKETGTPSGTPQPPPPGAPATAPKKEPPSIGAPSSKWSPAAAPSSEAEGATPISPSTSATSPMGNPESVVAPTPGVLPAEGPPMVDKNGIEHGPSETIKPSPVGSPSKKKKPMAPPPVAGGPTEVPMAPAGGVPAFH